ncbi:XdhC family protein [Allohahella marinimesophila]|uniref:XdhC family protein n=1 Tax=Allohahella marinimesophila TaxID=1054972 RepID=A0ABP7NQT2_9GAMM
MQASSPSPQATPGIFAQVRERFAAGDEVFLLTVVETFGSSPRPPGACLALCRSGTGRLQSAGSVSGGCIEAELLQYLAAHTGQSGRPLPDYAVETIYYGDSATLDPASLNQHFDLDTFAPPEGAILPCGGRMRLLIEYFGQGQAAAHRAHFDAIAQRLLERKSLVRTVDTGSQAYSLMPDDGHLHHAAANHRFSFHLRPSWRLLLIGANDVSRRLVPIGLDLGFEVTVCEPRDWFYQLAVDSAEWQQLPEGTLLQTLPDDLVDSRFSDRWSAIMALGHDPRIDDMALLAALASEAFFVGAMGSAKTSAKRRERLSSLGLSVSQIEKLNAPIGVDIGSKTPAEIAIASAATLIAARSRALTTTPASH